jgi:hypothetical protein
MQNFLNLFLQVPESTTSAVSSTTHAIRALLRPLVEKEDVRQITFVPVEADGPRQVTCGAEHVDVGFVCVKNVRNEWELSYVIFRLAE